MHEKTPLEKTYRDRVVVRQKRCKTGAELMAQLRDGPKTDALPEHDVRLTEFVIVL